MSSRVLDKQKPKEDNILWMRWGKQNAQDIRNLFISHLVVFFLFQEMRARLPSVLLVNKNKQNSKFERMVCASQQAKKKGTISNSNIKILKMLDGGCLYGWSCECFCVEENIWKYEIKLKIEKSASVHV